MGPLLCPGAQPGPAPDPVIPVRIYRRRLVARLVARFLAAIFFIGFFFAATFFFVAVLAMLCPSLSFARIISNSRIMSKRLYFVEIKQRFHGISVEFWLRCVALSPQNRLLQRENGIRRSKIENLVWASIGRSIRRKHPFDRLFHRSYCPRIILVACNYGIQKMLRPDAASSDNPAETLRTLCLR